MNRKKYIHTIFENWDNYNCLDVRSQEKQNNSPIPLTSPLPFLTSRELTHLKKEGFASRIGMEIMTRIESLSIEIISTKPSLLFDDTPYYISQAIWQHYQTQYPIYIYHGGIKSLLKESNSVFQKKYSFVTLFGETGVGKTDILNELEKEGQQVLNLEKIANHNGSTFGNLQKLLQPSQETFTLILAQSLSRLNPDLPIFVESEEASLGKNMIPLFLAESLKQGKKIRITLSNEERIERLVQQYGGVNDTEIKSGIEKLRFRLGKTETEEILKNLGMKNYHFVADHLIKYFDQSDSYLAISEERYDWEIENNDLRNTCASIIKKLA